MRRTVLFLSFLIVLGCQVFAVTPEFAELHREPLLPEKTVVLKKLLYVSGLINASYLGINDLVASLQLAKKSNNPAFLSAQLYSVKIGLTEKPPLFTYISKEIAFCEKLPNFPLGFNDSPEGPELMSVEFRKIAREIETINIKYESNDLSFLKREADRVVFSLFWTSCEKLHAMLGDIIFFIKKELKEEIPFQIFSK